MPRTGGVLSTTEAGNNPRQSLTEHARDLNAEPGQAKTKSAGGEMDAERQRQADEGHPATGKAQQDQEAAQTNQNKGQQQGQNQQKTQNKDQNKDQTDQNKNQKAEQNQKTEQNQKDQGDKPAVERKKDEKTLGAKDEKQQQPPPMKKNINQPDPASLSGQFTRAESRDQGNKIVQPWNPGASNEMSTKETTWGRIIRQGQEQGEVELRMKPTDRVPGTRRSYGENKQKDDDSLWGVDGARDDERVGLGGLRGFASQKWGELTGGRQDQNQSVWGMSRDELFNQSGNLQRDEFSGRNSRRSSNEYDRFKPDDSDWRRSNLDRNNRNDRTSDRDERRFNERDEDDKGMWEKIKEKGQEWKEDAKEWMDDKMHSSDNRDDNRQLGRDRRDDRFKNEDSDWRRRREVEDRLNRVEDRLDRDERRLRRFDSGERRFRERDEDDKGTWEKIKEKGQEWKEDAKEWMDDKMGSRQNDDRLIQSRSRSSDRFYDQTDEVEDITAGAPVRRTSLQPVVEEWKERQRGKAEEWKDWSQDKTQELKEYAKDKRDEWKRDAKEWKQDAKDKRDEWKQDFRNRSEGSFRRQRDQDDRSFRDERRFNERDEDDKGMWEKIKEKGQEWKEDAKEWMDDKMHSSDNRDDNRQLDRRFNERRVTDDRRFTDDRRAAPREESDWRRSRGAEELDRRFNRGERRFNERDEDDKGTWEKIKEKGQEWKEDAKEWMDDKMHSSDNNRSNLQSRFYRDDISAGAPVERASFSSWMDQQQEHARNWERMKESGVMFREPEFKLHESRFRLAERHDPTTELSSSAEEALTDHTDAFVEDGFLGLREVEEAQELEANAQSGSGVRSFFAGKWFDFTHDKQTVDRKYDDLRNNNRRDVQDWQQRTFEQRGSRGSQNDREQFNKFKSRFGDANDEQSFNSRFSSPSRMPVEDRLGFRGDFDNQRQQRSSSRGRNFDSSTGRTFDETRRGDWNDARFGDDQNERRFARSPLRNEERRGLYSWETSQSDLPKADFMSDAEYRTWDRYRLKLANAFKDRNAQIESDADLTGLMEDTKVRDDDWYNRRDQERKNEKKGWFGFGGHKKDDSKRDDNKFNAQEETKPLDISSWFKNSDESDNRSSR